MRSGTLNTSIFFHKNKTACLHSINQAAILQSRGTLQAAPKTITLDMSNSDAKPKLDLDLESAFLPAWAQKSTEGNPYAKFEGRDRDYTNRDGRGRKRGSDSGRPPRPRSRDPRSNDRRQGAGGRDNRPGGGGQQRSGGGQGRSGKGGNDQGDRRNRPQGRGPQRDRPRRSRQEILASLPQLKTQIIPEPKGVGLLAKRIRMQGRAYPLFDIAGLILQSSDRYHIRFSSQTPPKDQEQQKIWICKLDQSIWLNEAEVVQHVLQKYLDDFYSAEKTETEPPKGSFNFVAQCGMSGVVLGPPNYHGYQVRLRELHEERYSRMDFEHFKAKVKIVQDEAVVNKWLEEQSWTIEYGDKKDPEAKKLHSLEEVEIHFREKNFQGSIECVNSVQVSGDPKNQLSRPIRDLIRFHVDDQTRFPLQLATELSQQFTRQGLQFFKVNKTVTHVSVSRPHYLDLASTPVSDLVKRIVQFIDESPNCTRNKVLESLAPAPAAAEDPKNDGNGTSELPSGKAEGKDDTAAGESSQPVKDVVEVKPQAETTGEAKVRKLPKSESALTPEQAAVTTDLHWLIHQGHVIEFSNGKLETAKKPKDQPKKKSAKSSKKKSSEEASKKDKPAQKAEAKKSDDSVKTAETKSSGTENVEVEVIPETSQAEAGKVPVTEPPTAISHTEEKSDSADVSVDASPEVTDPELSKPASGEDKVESKEISPATSEEDTSKPAES